MRRDLAALRSRRGGIRRAQALARLADTAHSAAVERKIGALDRSHRAEPWLDYAIARRCLARDDQTAALPLLHRAQAALGPRDDAALVARVAFTIGGLQVTASEPTAAEVTLAWAEGLLRRRATASPDLAHLRALVAEQRGEREHALAEYRAALRRRADALTPLSTVLAMRNLGALLVDAEPSEARSLYAVALAQLEAHELDPAIRPGLANALGYALICLGDLPAAREALGRAERDAVAHRRMRIVLYARFNRAITDELAGRTVDARATLADVERASAAADLPDLASWARLRLAWLDLRSGEVKGVAARLGTLRGAAYEDAVQVLRGILAYRQWREAEARGLLHAAAKSLASRGDELGQFAVLLWSALIEERGGRQLPARRAVSAACAIGLRRGYVLSPNWWAPETVAAASRLAAREHLEYAAGLHRPPDAPARASDTRVRIDRDATVTIGTEVLAPERWRVGRSGSGVLRRLFGALMAAHPAGLHRDELADLLWPESEGDKAVRNLYAATDDLRRLLAEVPGVRLMSNEQRYVLVLSENVTLA